MNDVIYADSVVSKDGTGNFTTLKKAVAAAPDNSKQRFVIFMKKGIYDEVVNIEEKKTNLTIIGEGSDSTILTGSLNAKDGTLTTFHTATLGVDGVGFMAQDICIRNTAGPENGQAVALRVSGDMAVFYRCRIDGYQDTLYPYLGRQFYRDCLITGTVDFICGKAFAVFQHCDIEPRKPKEGQANMMTAQSGDDQEHRSAFAFHKCNIRASPDLAPLRGTVKTYLGRPWGVLSTVVVMLSFIDDLIDPAGWFHWEDDKEPRLSTLFYGEYENNGPGADTTKRVKWPG
ncbi:unnamed protein product [Thlaspi arvense]|uniref:pectinesterase n=1 Tax=Thlaspi arvense TaxID=13288 RepID=A0AAU9RC10_THLAR|nr:unnamed protein product [Thlaspi arvense]